MKPASPLGAYTYGSHESLHIVQRPWYARRATNLKRHSLNLTLTQTRVQYSHARSSQRSDHDGTPALQAMDCRWSLHPVAALVALVANGSRAGGLAHTFVLAPPAHVLTYMGMLVDTPGNSGTIPWHSQLSVGHVVRCARGQTRARCMQSSWRLSNK